VTRTALLILLCGTVAASAAELDGKWKLVYITENGLHRESTLEVKEEGGKLSGKLSSERGTAVIDTGAVNRDQISFSLLRKGNGDEIRVEYTGRIEDGVLKLTLRYGKREPVTVVGRRM
jgi:hypothetical protein